MRTCSWPIKCDKTCQPGSEYCPGHSKAVGIKPEKVVKMTAIKKVSDKKKAAAKLDKELKGKIDHFYEYALNAAPRHCEECGARLSESVVINPRTIVAHLLQKRKTGGFPSVAAHPENKAYLCQTCHDRYDNKGKDFIVKMKLYPEIKRRVSLLLPHLTPEELTRVPGFLIE